ncbi:MAG TPA: hypothetical protein VKT78_07740, partial [Fimbriimonadaceae bacterium]|nr:hypothetical protein [Fimbriimonadaceae bacterium]
YVSGTGTVQLQLVNDDSGSIGSTVLETWTMNTTGPWLSYSAPATLLGDGSASLTDQSTYWLVASVVDEPNSDLYAIWNQNSVGLLAPKASYFNGSWTYAPANTTGAFRFDVSPSPTPEPLTIGLAIAGVGIAIRRRMKG